MKNFLLFLCIFLILLFIIISPKQSSIKIQNTIHNVDKSYIEEPIQTEVDYPPEKININGATVTIDKLYSYEVTGRVVETYTYKEYYTGNKVYNTIASKDAGIVWGDLVTDENVAMIGFEMHGNRSLMYYVKDRKVFQTIGGQDKIGELISNNHLLASNEDVLKLIEQIEKDDFVRIKGYLVNATWDEGALLTSIWRNDSGHRSCEIILVEDVKWLQ